jgi:hypothetical protein
MEEDSYQVSHILAYFRPNFTFHQSAKGRRRERRTKESLTGLASRPLSDLRGKIYDDFIDKFINHCKELFVSQPSLASSAQR